MALPETVGNWRKAWWLHTETVDDDVWNSGYNRKFFFQPYLLSPLALPETVENWGKAWWVQTGAVGGDVWNSGYNRRFFRSH